MPSITARTPRALIVAYGEDIEALDDKVYNLQLIVKEAPSLRSSSEWRELAGLDETLPAPDDDVLVIAPNYHVKAIARNMELINRERTLKGLSAIFTDYEIKDVIFAAGGLPPPQPTNQPTEGRNS